MRYGSIKGLNMADIDIGKISEALNNKIDLPTGDSQDGIDFVVDWQDPTSTNGYTWYRKYKNGWVEQGGRVPLASGDGTTYIATVVMPIAMADTTYSITTTAMAVSSAMLTNSTNATRRVAGTLAAAVHMDSLTTTQFNVSKNSSSETIVFWVVRGYEA